MRKEVIGNATLYLGDCREIMPQIKADMVLTDPPFSARTHEGARGGAGETVLVDFAAFSEEQFLDVSRQLLELVPRWVIMFCDWRHAAEAEKQGLPVVRCGVWVKSNPMPQMTGDRPGTGWEAVLIMHPPGKKRWNGGGRAAVWNHGTTRYGNFGPSNHPTEKPVGLVKRLLLDFTDEGETIFDPFMGSGSHGVACMDTKRQYIGCEIDSKHFDTACQRILAAQQQLCLAL
ncbi:MAG: hypothetical protein A2Y38_24840 [Spirochaetes bacterium GWB1_59_5]|nr:MAG: hypothetical protein A2Y38_24840 [Spirochaetes bacterium GWB1_59_5]